MRYSNIWAHCNMKPSLFGNILLVLSTLNAITSWNKGDHCTTTVPITTLDRLLRYVSCCQFAYQLPRNANTEILLQYFQEEGLISHHPFFHKKEKRNVAGYILVFPDEIVVAFRGTLLDGHIRSELWNNFNNRLVQQTFQGVSVGVHRGVYNEYQEIREEFLEKMEKVLEEVGGNRPIVFTGHSIGSVCQIAALEYHERIHNSPCQVCTKIQCVTFGAYKMFNDADLFRRIGIENIRVRFQNDFVPSYPWFPSFVHAHTQDIVFFHKRRIEHRIIYYKLFIQRLRKTRRFGTSSNRRPVGIAPTAYSTSTTASTTGSATSAVRFAHAR